MSFLTNQLPISLRYSKCIGCEYDLPGQRDHMEGGCLTEWNETVDKYFSEVKNKMSSVQVVKVVLKVMEVLKIENSMSEPELLTVVLNVSMREDIMKTELIHEIKDIREDFYVLFDEICPNLREFTMYP